METIYDNCYGTFVASFLYNKNAYLFSDGLLTSMINNTKTVVYDDYSKIHKVNDKCAYLTYGRLLNKLHDDIVNDFPRTNCMDSIIKHFSQKLTHHWSIANQNNVKTGAILVVKNNQGVPFHCSMDSNSQFKVNDIHSCKSEDDVQFASVCTDEQKYNSSMLLTSELKKRLAQGIDDNLFINCFNTVKGNLSDQAIEVGGKTFYLKL